MSRAGLAIASLVVCTSLASAQELQRFELSLNGAGVFSRTTTSSNGVVIDRPTKSLEIFGTVQYRFTPKHSLELNIGHTNNSQIFTLPPDSFRISSAITEYTGAYLLTPFTMKRLEPFLLAGAGGLRFKPGNSYIDGFQAPFGAAQQTSLAFVYGGGADYRLWRRLILKLQYRGFIYKVPDFKVQSLFTGARGHMAEPSLGLAVKF